MFYIGYEVYKWKLNKILAFFNACLTLTMWYIKTTRDDYKNDMYEFYINYGYIKSKLIHPFVVGLGFYINYKVYKVKTLGFA